MGDREQIVCYLQHADELEVRTLTIEYVAAELSVSMATFYNWRRQYRGVSVDAPKELKVQTGVVERV